MEETRRVIQSPFIGRTWLVSAIRDWIVSPAQYLFITGPPGTGKSAVVDHLWGQGDSPHEGRSAVHRCRATDRRSCDPIRFAESLAQQLGESIAGFAEALMHVSTELAGRPGEVHITGAASAGTVHSHGSVF